MKIKYHISGTADIESSELTERIFSLLSKPGYIILENTCKTIRFKDNIWRVGSRSNVFGRVDGGSFKINTQGNGVVTDHRLYQLVRQQGSIQDRTFVIEFQEAGVQAFSFTFG